MKKLTLSVLTEKRPIDPLEIFNKLTLRGSIENVWEPQAKALREWYEKRSNSDVAIEMNTGGGKTLVGLLIAQSLVNETKGRVLYVCSNNQLVEQTFRRAKEIGLSTARRYMRKWFNEGEFEDGNTFCLTNYAAAFNGKSVFRDKDIDALVFDDAHVAENHIRNQFTLKIASNHEAFRKILNLCRSHFANSSKEDQFQDVVDGHCASVMFIPTFTVWKHARKFRKILLDSEIENNSKTTFAWEYLKEHIKHCCFVTDGRELQISPAILPLSRLKYFQGNTRRVYLTATLPSRVSFARTFGIPNPTIIRPSGRSGDAQRLFVFVPGKDDGEQRAAAKDLVKDRKSCVISPSLRKGNEWIPPATIYDTQSGQPEIDRFAKSKSAEMLGLVARYDGIDLPGDACKLLILDRLPTGESMIDQFVDESIQVETIRVSHTATRVVQAIGRIFRSNTDHGVVFLVGQQLQSWVRSPKNRAYLPELLQKQILLGVELIKQIKQGKTKWEELIEALLTGDKNWDETYNDHIHQFDTSVTHSPPDWHTELVLGEHKALDQLWTGQPQQAADSYETLATDAHQHDPRLSAWYRHWRGLALLCVDNHNLQEAIHEFNTAANERSELGRPPQTRDKTLNPPVSDISDQAKNLTELSQTKKKSQICKIIEQVENDLVYGPDTSKAEEALKQLGTLIGLQAERPDKSKGTGPDVTWHGGGVPSVWGFELKTNKDEAGKYSKEDISQCHDHEQWLVNEYGSDGNVKLAIVGRMLPISETANPSPSLRIIEVVAFRDLLKRVRKLFEDVESDQSTNLEQSFQSWLNHYGLNWPNCVDALENRLADDLHGK